MKKSCQNKMRKKSGKINKERANPDGHKKSGRTQKNPDGHANLLLCQYSQYFDDLKYKFIYFYFIICIIDKKYNEYCAPH